MYTIRIPYPQKRPAWSVALCYDQEISESCQSEPGQLSSHSKYFYISQQAVVCLILFNSVQQWNVAFMLTPFDSHPDKTSPRQILIHVTLVIVRCGTGIAFIPSCRILKVTYRAMSAMKAMNRYAVLRVDDLHWFAKHWDIHKPSQTNMGIQARNRRRAIRTCSGFVVVS